MELDWKYFAITTNSETNIKHFNHKRMFFEHVQRDDCVSKASTVSKMNKQWIDTTPFLWGSGKSHLSFMTAAMTVFQSWMRCATPSSFSLIEEETEVYGMKAGVNSSLGVSIFSFRTELFYLSLTHLRQQSHYRFFSFDFNSHSISLLHFLSPLLPDCIFPFVADFGTIPLQITFPSGKRLLLSLQSCRPTPPHFLFHPHLPLSLSLRHSKQIDTVWGFSSAFQTNPV